MIFDLHVELSLLLFCRSNKRSILISNVTAEVDRWRTTGLSTNRALAVFVRVDSVQDMEPQGTNLEASFWRAAPLNYAGFWIRVFAGLIDFIILLIPFSVVVSFAAVGMNIWYSFFFATRPGQPLPEDLARKGPMLLSIGVSALILFGWLYFALLESSNWRGTLGKHMLGLYVADERGDRIGFWRASQRFAAGRLLMHVPIVGLYYFIVDCSCIMVVPRNRAIHDVLSRCLVLARVAASLKGPTHNPAGQRRDSR